MNPFKTPSGTHSLRPQFPVNGEVIGDKYVVEGLLGEGGMGFVVSARHVELDELVALKFLRPEYQTEEVVGRFAREARASAKLRSEHAIKVLDVGQSPVRGPYIVMEHLEGRSTSQALEQEGVFSVEAAVDIALQACAALAEAHGKGIIHRDVKPENLFLARRDTGDMVKVLDFGVSKAAFGSKAFGSSPDLVKTTTFIGSPLYMSPEQLRSADSVDARSDIWSLGATVYEFLTRRPPYVAPDVAALVSLVLETEPPPMSQFRADVPPELTAILLRCLARKPEDRFDSVAALAVAIAPFGSGRRATLVEEAEHILATTAGGALRTTRDSLVSSRISSPTAAALVTTSAPPSAPAPNPSKLPWIVAAVLGAVVLAGAWVTLRPTSPAAASGQGAASSAPAAVPVAFRSVPANAELRIDGGPPMSAPIATTLSPGRHTYRAAAPGYEAAAGVFDVAADGHVPDPLVTLMAADAGAPAPSTQDTADAGGGSTKTGGRRTGAVVAPPTTPPASPPTTSTAQPSRPPRVIDDAPPVKVIQ